MNDGRSRRRRALVVAYDFPPHGAIGTMRTLRVVRRLVEEDWDVTVLTSDPRTFRSGTPVEQALMSRVPAGIRIVRAPSFRGFDALKRIVKGPPGTEERSDAQALRRPKGRMAGGRGHLARATDLVDAALAIPDHESGWLIPAVMRGLATIRSYRPDVIYSSAPPWTGQIVARVLATASRCQWVADFRDPWSRAPWRGDRFGFAIRAAVMLERQVVRRADRILFVAQGNRDDFAVHYGPDTARKFHVIPNGCDIQEFDALSEAPAVPDDMCVLLHAGSLYAGRSPGALLKAIAVAIEQGIVDPSRFRLRFLGHLGLASVDLSRTCRELGLEQVVEVVARVPREQSLQAMRSASALLLLQPGHTVSVPGKLYEYLASGRPILAVAEEGEIADIVRQSGVGVFATPDDEAGIVAALASLIPMVKTGVGAAPRELYDGMLRAAEAVRVLDAVVRGDSPSPADATVVEANTGRVRTR